MKFFFGNSGKKIKIVVMTMFILLVCYYIFLGFCDLALASQCEIDEIKNGYLTSAAWRIIGMPIILWVSGLFLYAFGELVESVFHIKERVCVGTASEFVKRLSDVAEESTPKPSVGNGVWVCPKCGKKNNGGMLSCSDCGTYK